MTIRVTVHNDGTTPGQFVAAAECGFDEIGRTRLLRDRPWFLAPGTYQTFWVTPEQCVMLVLGRAPGNQQGPATVVPQAPQPEPLDVLG